MENVDRDESKQIGCDAGWAKREFEGVALGDRRLERRLIRIAEELSKQPEYPINQACQDAKATKAAYRFFDNEKAGGERLLGVHCKRTLARMRNEPVVLAIQDTTYLNFSGHKKTKGLGPIGDPISDPQGLILHSTFAVNPSGLPLGILTHNCWAQEGYRESADAHQQMPIEEKESFRWVTALRDTTRLSVANSTSMVVTVADRECDIYEFLLEAQALNAKYVIRATHNRAIRDSEHSRIRELAAVVPVQGNIEISVPSQRRKIFAEVRFAEVTLCAPHRITRSKSKLNVSCWAITVDEIPSKDTLEPLSWTLLTNIPTVSLDQALQRVAWYRRRWAIEEFHKILKSGCTVEENRLQTAERLKRYLALMCIIAWRIFWLVHIQRANPKAPAEVALTQSEIGTLLSLERFEDMLDQNKPMTIRQAVIAIACLGGYLNRKNDKPPGAIVIWRGWQRLSSMAELYDGMTKKRCG